MRLGMSVDVQYWIQTSHGLGQRIPGLERRRYVSHRDRTNEGVGEFMECLVMGSIAETIVRLFEATRLDSCITNALGVSPREAKDTEVLLLEEVSLVLLRERTELGTVIESTGGSLLLVWSKFECVSMSGAFWTWTILGLDLFDLVIDFIGSNGVNGWVSLATSTALTT